jgi:choline dehydrogenase-like flavoprotein
VNRARLPSMVDVLIVGSGPVGSAFARTVLDHRPSTDVLMVEVGPPLTDQPGMNVRNLRRPPEAAVLRRLRDGLERSSDQDGMPAAAMASNVGGMGALWACACPRPNGSERIPFIPAAEWESAALTAERLLRVTTSCFTGRESRPAIARGLAESVHPPLPLEHRVQAMPLACTAGSNGVHWTGSDTILGPLLSTETRARTSFRLVPETICRRLVVEGSRATRAVLEHLPSGEQVVAGARVVVVAADALRTPQLLWASGIRPPALGHYLNDQPMLVATAYVRDGTSRVGTALACKLPEQFFRDHLAGVFWVPFVDGIHPFHGQALHLLVPASIRSAPRSVVSLGWYCAKDIQFDDSIVFSDLHNDANGMPAMTIDYRLTEADWRSVARATDVLERVGRTLGGFLAKGEPWLLPAGSSFHYQGTTRMGPADDGGSVCGPDLRVWGLDNLYVGGNGVIPTATACNPTLTSVALAVRAATRIAERL